MEDGRGERSAGWRLNGSLRLWAVGLMLVAACWGLIIAAGAMFVVWPNPLTYVLAIMLIGARQLGLAIPMHDAAHGASGHSPGGNGS